MKTINGSIRMALLIAAITVLPIFSVAQEMDHSKMKMPPSETTPDTKAPPKTDPHAGHTMPNKPAPKKEVDHEAMGHSAKKSPDQPRQPIPKLTPEDRAAAFPDVGNHAAHDNTIQSFVLFNQLETWDADAGTGAAWEGQGWIGTDLNRLWLRSEGERLDGTTESADLEAFYGRSVSRWWDVVTGVRSEIESVSSQNFAAIGLIGLAPYKFELEAIAYIGESGQSALRLEAEYDLLLTNRLVLQPLIEMNFHGKDDELRGIGSGLSNAEAGLRLRYEFRREFAPYLGIKWEKAYGTTADFVRASGESVDDSEWVVGLRTWF